MSAAARPRRPLVAGGLLVTAVAGCLAEPGEVVLYVDTDLPVPAIASRLRVDLFGSDGRWFDSRDFVLPNPTDWPASFAVTSDSATLDKEVLVRLRAYPFGRERDYRGERFAERPTYREPFVAHSLDELCDAPPELRLGQAITVRRGRTPIFSAPCGGDPNAVGAAAVAVNIAAPGRYTFGVLDVSNEHAEATLRVRGVCTEAHDLGCVAGAINPGGTYRRPIVTVQIDQPALYFAIVSGAYLPDGAADVTLGAAREAEWQDVAFPAPAVPQAPGPSGPRLLRTGPGGPLDATPAREPQPAVAVDRLAGVRVRPGARDAARVTLRGACAGTMAMLDARAPLDGTVAPGEASTCVDEEGVRGPVEVVAAGAERPPAPSLRGSFGAGAGCPPEGGDEPAACIAGGPMVLGGPDRQLSGNVLSATPERIAAMSTFWLDRHEVTVEGWRRALDAGFRPERLPGVNAQSGPLANNAPLGRSLSMGSRLCTYSSRPLAGDDSREHFGLNCISWYDARSYCRWRGGDLPTEAQYEYAAAWAGRAVPGRYPWGDAAPDCARVVFGRSDGSPVESVCSGGLSGPSSSQPYGLPPAPLSRAEAGDDVTASGVLGLAGGLAEMCLDAAARYDDPCWRAAGLRDPACLEEEAPRRAVRGGAWSTIAWYLDATSRLLSEPVGGYPWVGFRCAFGGPPER